MSKPEDIPQDVWDAAERAWQASYATRGMRTGLTFAPVARAIMAAKEAEREAIASLLNDPGIDIEDRFAAVELIRKRGEA